MTRWKALLNFEGWRKNTYCQKMKMCLLLVHFHCVYFAMTTPEVPTHVVSRGIDPASARDSTRQAGIVLNEGENGKDAGLFSGKRGFEDLFGNQDNSRPYKIHTKTILEGYPALSDKDLVAKDKAISTFSTAYDNFKSHDITSSKLHNEKLEEDEKLQLRQIEWGDRIVSKIQKGGPSVLHSLREEVKQNVINREVRVELEKTLNLAERDWKNESWWNRIINFFRYVFKRDEWKQDKASHQLSKLRRGLRSRRTLEPVPTEKMRKAITHLSIFARKGPNFSDAELQLIENMSNGSSHLTAADEALIAELGKETVAQHRNMKIRNLQETYHLAIENQTSQDITKKDVLEALAYLWARVGTGKDWSKQDRKMYEKLEKMKSMKDALYVLAQDKRTQEEIIARADKWRLLENRGKCATAFAMLTTKSELAAKEKKVLEALRVLWDEGKLSSDHGFSLRKFGKGRRAILRENVEEFNKRMQDFLKKAQPIDTSRHYLDHIKSIENELGTHNTPERYIAGSQDVDSMATRGLSLTGRKEKYLNKLKNKFNLNKILMKDVEKD
ncbi:hypothetical protein PGTUg99_025309 [Puccinia graminis f. sp. tritici]|uniref:Uncharacterized protein n=1 Tax=Puccinia graminis f. sp. tritici TaxID=56615 RepID=A0A5B0S6B3_PUCGR|nr:hypothetical protein PGTUg99_025309 [Puccinia graminis f. sp. tritici]